MPTFRQTASYIKILSEDEYLLLKTVEKLSKKFERVSIKLLAKSIVFSDTYILRLIKKLSRNGFLTYFKQPYESVMLLSSGADLLALKKLSDKGIVVGIGRQIGVGKEADVFEVISEYGEKFSLKVYRLGRVSFRGIVRKRSYSYIKSSHKWLFRNYVSAKREYENLTIVYQRGISAPRPIYRVMHMLVMEYLDGFLLSDLKQCQDPEGLFTNIIREIKRTWDLGFVNGDLSEYNIFLLKDDLKPVLIDWPQAISRDEPMAYKLLKRDITNIVSFFEKKFKYNIDKKKLFKNLFKKREN